jgi:hypothetical protein
MMADIAYPAADAGEESLIILQSLLCLLREKNVLTRADIEELSQKMEQRAAGQPDGPLGCCPESAKAASADMERITHYIGQRYGGKHARSGAARPLPSIVA